MAKVADLIMGMGISHGTELLLAYSPFGEFSELLRETLKKVPPNMQWFSWGFDQVIFLFHMHLGYIFSIAAYECFTRKEARSKLTALRDLFLSSSSSTPSPPEKPSDLPEPARETLEKTMKSWIVNSRGVVPARLILILHPGAPKKFLTKEDQAPDFVQAAEGSGTARLKSALEEIDENDDDFVFTIRKPGAGSGGGDDDDGEDFVFNIPKKIVQAVAAPMIFTSPHPRQMPAFAAGPTAGSGGGGGGGNSGSNNRVPSGQQSGRKSPAMSGAKVSPDDADGGKDGGGTWEGEKIRGQVGMLAPSGLTWEEEIASQLASVGVLVGPAKAQAVAAAAAAVKEGKAGAGDGSGGGGAGGGGGTGGGGAGGGAAAAAGGAAGGAGAPGATAPRNRQSQPALDHARSFSTAGAGVGFGMQGSRLIDRAYVGMPAQAAGRLFARNTSVPNGGRPAGGAIGAGFGGGLGRLARGIKKTFNLQSSHDKLIG
ncbi:hypothetical protein CLOP_g16199 [Closterium sp. NIES-67]|nr:hypothetical protein CLOP_g16199 [Closterium sp. NIES-67]